MSWLSYPPRLYRINAYSIYGENPLLQGSSKYFTVREPVGFVDSLRSNGIGGWAWKPDASNESVSVHLYVTTTSGNTAFFDGFSASAYRSDLAHLDMATLITDFITTYLGILFQRALIT